MKICAALGICSICLTTKFGTIGEHSIRHTSRNLPKKKTVYDVRMRVLFFKYSDIHCGGCGAG